MPDLLADLGVPEQEVWQVLGELQELGMIELVTAAGGKHPIVVLGVTRRGRRALRPWLRMRNQDLQPPA
jgi:hypothetical protein